MITILMALVLQTQAPSSTTLTFGATATQRFRSDLDADGADVALSHARASGEWFQAFSRADFLKVVGSGNVFRYDWAGTAAGLPEDFRDLRLEGTFIHAYGAHWRGIAYASAHMQIEEGADPGDGGSYGAAGGALYRFGPDLSVGGLVGALTRIEDRPFFFVQPNLEWKPSPWWTVRTDSRDGFGLEATHILDEGKEWALQGRLIYTTRRFRLDEDAVRPGGIFQDSRTAFLAGVRWQAAQNVSLTLTLGLDLMQEFRLEDDGGDAVTTFESDPGALLGFEVSGRF